MTPRPFPVSHHLSHLLLVSQNPLKVRHFVSFQDKKGKGGWGIEELPPLSSELWSTEVELIVQRPTEPSPFFFEGEGG